MQHEMKNGEAQGSVGSRDRGKTRQWDWGRGGAAKRRIDHGGGGFELCDGEIQTSGQQELGRG